jgi:4a-hydroxytetrahydrobiopterin dehydratase
LRSNTPLTESEDETWHGGPADFLAEHRAMRHHDFMTKLTGQQIADEALNRWVYLLNGLQTRIRTPDFATGLSVVNAIGAAAEEMDHHPDLDLRYSHVDVRLSTHDVHGVTDLDIRLARTISSIAADAGLEMERASVSRLELALDTPAFSSVLPFWGAVLTMDRLAEPGFGDELRDPSGALPTVWFQAPGSEEPRQRWHFDVWVDPAQVQPRIDAALAAGGTLVSDEEAPSFWVLADPDGNRVCLCTWQERNGSDA